MKARWFLSFPLFACLMMTLVGPVDAAMILNTSGEDNVNDVRFNAGEDDDYVQGNGVTGTPRFGSHGNSSDLHIAVVKFDITAASAAINAAPEIELWLTPRIRAGDVYDGDIRHFGTTSGVVEVADASTAGTSVGTATFADLAPDNTLKFDVTSVVKAAAAAGDDFAAFRVEPLGYTDGSLFSPQDPRLTDGNNDRVLFYQTGQHSSNRDFDPQLVVIPEPASLGLLGMGAGLVLLRRRR